MLESAPGGTLPGLSMHPPSGQEDAYQVGPTRRADWEFASRIVSVTRVDWAIGTFQPYKAPGADGVYPALLQKGLEDLRLTLTKLYRANIAIGHVPTAWKHCRVAFLPKPGKEGYTAAKDFRPTSLTSFIFKVLEKLVERFIRDTVLPGSPLHRGQHAFPAGRFVLSPE